MSFSLCADNCLPDAPDAHFSSLVSLLQVCSFLCLPQSAQAESGQRDRGSGQWSVRTCMWSLIFCCLAKLGKILCKMYMGYIS